MSCNVSNCVNMYSPIARRDGRSVYGECASCFALPRENTVQDFHEQTREQLQYKTPLDYPCVSADLGLSAAIADLGLCPMVVVTLARRSTSFGNSKGRL